MAPVVRPKVLAARLHRRRLWRGGAQARPGLFITPSFIYLLQRPPAGNGREASELLRRWSSIQGGTVAALDSREQTDDGIQPLRKDEWKSSSRIDKV